MLCILYQWTINKIVIKMIIITLKLNNTAIEVNVPINVTLKIN